MDKEAKQYLARQRYMDALRWREAGLTYKEIGKKFGVSYERARQLCGHGQRLKQKGHYSAYLSSQYNAER
jgi:DNA-directed RNA polymerase sigma subunit (sigma70/sigma32)